MMKFIVVLPFDMFHDVILKTGIIKTFQVIEKSRIVCNVTNNEIDVSIIDECVKIWKEYKK